MDVKFEAAAPGPRVTVGLWRCPRHRGHRLMMIPAGVDRAALVPAAAAAAAPGAVPLRSRELATSDTETVEAPSFPMRTVQDGRWCCGGAVQAQWPPAASVGRAGSTARLWLRERGAAWDAILPVLIHSKVGIGA